MCIIFKDLHGFAEFAHELYGDPMLYLKILYRVFDGTDVSSDRDHARVLVWIGEDASRKGLRRVLDLVKRKHTTRRKARR